MTGESTTGEPTAGEPVWAEEAPARRRTGPIVLGAALALSATVWIAALVGFLVLAAPPGGLSPLRIAAWIGLGSGPLALLAVIALLVLRTGLTDATAYSRAARGLRGESAALADMLQLLTRRIELARAGLAEQSTALSEMGEVASERLARAGEGLRDQAAAVAATAAALDDSAASARTDLGVILADLPQAEALATAFGERVRSLGAEANAQAGTLGERIGALVDAARNADQVGTGAARRLAAELERIEGGAAAADRRIGDAAAQLAEASALALGDSVSALDDVRRGVDAQRTALLAAIDQARASFDQEGALAGAGLDARLATIAEALGSIDGRLRTQEQAATALVADLDRALSAAETRLAALGAEGGLHTAGLAETIVELGGQADQLGRMLGHNNETAQTLVARAETLRGHIEASGAALGGSIPASLSRVRLHAEQNLRAIDEAVPRADQLAASIESIAGHLGTADAAIGRQQEAMTRIGDEADARLAALAAQADAFHDLLQRTDAEIRALAQGSSTQLVDAMLRVRDTAAKAAEHARETLASAIPDAARRLGEQSASAVGAALHGIGAAELAAVGEASAQAIEAARAASDRLARQLAAINETSSAIETRLAAQDEQGFARQVGLLIESLNSSAIDVAKIFSNEPTDTAWAAYLKGDRGIFTRRAVHLLESADARTIAARYGDDPEFREQVNRYVHDFETMLRRVLAVREGGAMGVTLLSSDTGKLYVALSQAIERLRR